MVAHMKTYTVASRPQRALEVVWVIAGTLIFVVPVLRSGAVAWGLIFLVFVVLVPLAQSIGRVNVICLHDDGTIEFQCLLGTIRLNARDITGLAGIRKDRDYGGVDWSMRVWHRGNWTTVPK